MKLILGNTMNAVFDGTLNEMKKRLENGGEHVLIVPDRFSMNAEKLVLEKLGIEATFNIEIVSFTRLAQKVLEGQIKKCLTPEGSVAMLSYVVEKYKDSFVHYKKSVNTKGFTNELYASLTAIRNSGITPQKLREVAKCMSGSVSRKLLDTAFIFEKYLEELEKKFTDSSTRLEKLAEFLEENSNEVAKSISNFWTKDFYVANFFDFKAPELAILKQLENFSHSLTVGLVCAKANQNARIFPNHLEKKMREIAGENVEELRVFEKLQSPFAEISDWLYSYELPQKVFGNGKVEIFKSKNIENEVKQIAIKIKKMVVEDGKRYSDFGISVPDDSGYEEIVKAVFRRYEIPFFIDKQESLASYYKAKFLCSAMEVATSHFEKSAVLAFVKNACFGGDVSAFEIYVEAMNIDFSRFLEPFVFEHWAKIEAEKTREKMVALLSLVMTDELSAEEFVLRIEKLLNAVKVEALNFEQKIAETDEFYKKCLEQSDKKLNSIFEEITQIFDGTSFQLSHFSELLKSMLESQKIALLPLYLDSVFVGDANDSRFWGIDSLFVAGSQEGKMPKLGQGGLFVTVKDEQELRKFEVSIFPSTRQKNLTAMFQIVDLLTKPTKKLFVSFSEFDNNGVEQKPAYFISQLQDLICDDEQLNDKIQIQNVEEQQWFLERENFEKNQNELSFRFATKKACFAEILSNVIGGSIEPSMMNAYDVAYEKIEDSQKKLIENIYKKVEKIAPEIFVGNEKQEISKTSVSRLEKFYRCPYQYYFCYGLKLKKVEEAKVLTSELGTILHGVLEKFFKLKIEDESKIAELVGKIFDEIVSEDRFKMLASSSDSKGIFRRLREESQKVAQDLFAIQKKSKFKPFVLEGEFSTEFDEVEFEKHKNDEMFEAKLKPLEIEIGDRKFCLIGKIDRVDKFENKFVIYDYKSFKSVHLDAKSVYFGEKLQLYIYMLALKNNFDMQGVGAYYLPIYSSYTKNDEKNHYELAGQTLADRFVVESLDSEFFECPSNSILPLTVKKNGELNSSSSAISEQGFEVLMKTAEKTAKEGLKQIDEGMILASPTKGSCEFCDYSDICKHKGQNEREFYSVSVDNLIEFDQLHNNSDCEQEEIDDEI